MGLQELGDIVKRFLFLQQSLLTGLPRIKAKLESKSPFFWKRRLTIRDYKVIVSYHGFGKLRADLSEYFGKHPNLEEEYRRKYTNDLMTMHLKVSSMMTDVKNLLSERLI